MSVSKFSARQWKWAASHTHSSIRRWTFQQFAARCAHAATAERPKGTLRRRRNTFRIPVSIGCPFEKSQMIQAGNADVYANTMPSTNCGHRPWPAWPASPSASLPPVDPIRVSPASSLPATDRHILAFHVIRVEGSILLGSAVTSFSALFGGSLLAMLSFLVHRLGGLPKIISRSLAFEPRSVLLRHGSGSPILPRNQTYHPALR